MNILTQILAYLCAPLVLLSGWVGLRGGITESPKPYKNVILMIGDGMGENTLKATLADDPAPLKMETMKVRGQSKTNSWPGFIVTDSAAGATALASGIRNINGEIGVFALDFLQWVKTPANLAELAVKNGRLAGVVTTDSTSGATPAAFSAHTLSRDSEEDISNDQLACDLTLIWGAGSKSVTKEKAEKNGYSFITTRSQMLALRAGGRSFAQFSSMSKIEDPKLTPTLKEMTKAAIDMLDDDPDGFFLMVEGAHIDKYAHSGDLENAIRHVREFDAAIEYAMDFAASHPGTLVLVTADHETGGVTLKNGKYVTTTGGHTWANVPVFVNAADAGFENGKAWKNREIGVQLGRILGFGPDVFPTPILPRISK